MKWWHLDKTLDQIAKSRADLGNYHSTPGRITRPAHIKPYLFRAKIIRLRVLEKKAERLLTEGLKKYIKTKERNHYGSIN